MQNFEYVAAKTVAEAVALLSGDGGIKRVMAGGTDLLVQLREGRRTATLLVDVKNIPELTRLAYSSEDGLRIGAAAACFRVCDFLQSRRIYPGLVDAVSLIGGTQIQGRASLGGNLANASPAADSIPALITHRGVGLICGPDGFRELPVEQICSAPGRNTLAPGELIVEVRVPTPPPGFGAAYQRFIPRNEMDIAVVGVGVAVTLDEKGETFLDARIALGAVAPTPLLVPQAGEWLLGRPVNPENIETAARIAQEAARPIDDMRGSAEQRRRLAYVLTRRTLAKAVARASAPKEAV